MRVAQPGENSGGAGAIAECPEHRDPLLVVVDGLSVVPGLVVDVAEAVQRARFTGRMTELPVQDEYASADRSLILADPWTSMRRAGPDERIAGNLVSPTLVVRGSAGRR